MKSKKNYKKKINKKKSLKGGNKFKVPMDKMTLEQICNQAGYNSLNEVNQQNSNLDINNLKGDSQELSGGVISKIKNLGSAVTWFPRKVFNVALNTTGLDKMISNQISPQNQNENIQNENSNIQNENSNNNIQNENSNNNIQNENNNIVYKSNNCVDNIDELCNSCNEPTQLIDLHNKVVKRIKNLNKNFFNDNLHQDIDRLKIIDLNFQKGGKIKSIKKKRNKLKKNRNKSS